MRLAFALPATAFVGLALAACGGGSSGAPETEPVPLQFVDEVDHAYFPLTPGAAWTLEGDEDGERRRDEVRVGEERRRILGVECTPLVQDVTVDGVLVETTTEWFAQDRGGNVWKFGEESLELDDDGLFVPTDDSWIAGTDGARPWQAFAASPRVGDVYEGYQPGGVDRFRVESVTETVTVPAGTFEGCLRLLENPDDPEDADVLLYAPGVGRVSETSSSGRIDLVELR